MGTTTYCDSGTPLEEGGTFHPAEWQLCVEYMEGSVVNAEFRLDACALHVHDALTEAIRLVGETERGGGPDRHFHSVHVWALDAVGGEDTRG